MYNNIETLPDLPSAAPVHLRHYHVINTMIWVISQDDHHATRLSSCTHHSQTKHAHTVGVSPKIVSCNSSYGCFVLGVTPLVWCQGMRVSSWGSGRWCHLRRGGGGLTKTDSTIMGLGVLAKPRMAHASGMRCNVLWPVLPSFLCALSCGLTITGPTEVLQYNMF